MLSSAVRYKMKQKNSRKSQLLTIRSISDNVAIGTMYVLDVLSKRLPSPAIECKSASWLEYPSKWKQNPLLHRLHERSSPIWVSGRYKHMESGEFRVRFGDIEEILE